MSADIESTNKKKILHFMPDNFVWGGIEVYLQHTLPLLQKSGEYEIYAVVTQDSKLFHALKDAGVRVWGIPFLLRRKSFLRSLWVNPWCRLIDFIQYIYLYPILNQVKPDLIHLHNGRIEQALIKFSGIPMVYTYHGYAGAFTLESVSNRLLKTIYILIRPLFSALIPFLSGMTVVSHYEKERLYREKFVPKDFEMEVIHNGLPLETLQKSIENFSRETFRRDLNIPEKARVISFICRLRQDKNPEAFLRIAKRTALDPRLKNPVYFLVAGEGKAAHLFQETFTEDPVLSKCGKYLGLRSDVPQIITASDFTLSTSLQEGFGLRVLESFIFGKLCIAYSCGGIPEIMNQQAELEKWLVPIDDEDMFVETLVSAVNLPDSEMDCLSIQLKAQAETFDIQGHIKKMEGFYKGIFETSY